MTNPFSISNPGFLKTAYDSEAQAVIDAIQLTDPLTTAYKDAINFRITRFKFRGTWSKLKGYIGMVGGTASAHKWNWKDLRDLDAAFRATFIGSPTHSATGIKGNGSSQYINLNCVPSTDLLSNNLSASVYTRLNVAGAAAAEFGANQGTNQILGIVVKFTDGNSYNDAYSFASTSNRAVYANANTQGLHGITRGSLFKAYKNGVLKATASTLAGSLPSIPVYGLARNDNGTISYSANEIASIKFGLEFTAQEMADDYTDEQAFQTMLSRQV